MSMFEPNFCQDTTSTIINSPPPAQPLIPYFEGKKSPLILRVQTDILKLLETKGEMVKRNRSHL